MTSSIHFVMYNPVRYAHIRVTISFCQEVKCCSVTICRLYCGHIGHCIRSYTIKIRMFQKSTGISGRRNQQNTCYRDSTFTRLLQHSIKWTLHISLIKIICPATVSMRNISFLLRKMHEMRNRNVDGGTGNTQIIQIRCKESMVYQSSQPLLRF